MKKLTLKTLIFVLLLSFVSISIAGECGGGKILSVFTGGWNTNNLFVLVDNTKWPNQHPGTLWGGRWIVYQRNHLDPDRFKTITALAISSFSAKSDVWTYSVNNSCDDASELGLGTR